MRCATAAPIPETVAVLGIGGLGHLSVQFASKMDFRTIAIPRGKDKRAKRTAREMAKIHWEINQQLQRMENLKVECGGPADQLQLLPSRRHGPARSPPLNRKPGCPPHRIDASIGAASMLRAGVTYGRLS
jgi:hypothetical protein